MNFAGGTLDARQLVEHFTEMRAQHVDIDPGLRKQRPHRTALLVEQG
jgi:hypothetical protein